MANPETIEVQRPEEGTGPLYHRIYRIRLKTNWQLALEAMAELQRCPDDCSPQWIAVFEKTKGDPGAMRVGDEFVVQLPSRWEAPVRVCAMSPTHFRFETLKGHPESGQIEFRIVQLSSESTLFEIESLARSQGALMDFIYDKLHIARYVQQVMWEKFCTEFAAHAEAGAQEHPASDVQVITEKREKPGGEWVQV